MAFINGARLSRGYNNDYDEQAQSECDKSQTNTTIPQNTQYLSTDMCVHTSTHVCALLLQTLKKPLRKAMGQDFQKFPEIKKVQHKRKGVVKDPERGEETSFSKRSQQWVGYRWKFPSKLCTIDCSKYFTFVHSSVIRH